MPTRERRAKSLSISVDQLPDGRGKHKNHVKGGCHPRWNDGRMLSEDGYVKVRVGVDHPLADSNGYAYEHLLVWIGAGNQKPQVNELLHHKNDDKTDNRIKNLELLTRGEHNAHHNAERGRDKRGHFRGHQIAWVDGRWIYEDTKESVAQMPSRVCGFCGIPNTAEGHDSCLGALPGVMNACCGHGVQSEAYIQFTNGVTIRGFEIDKQ